MNQKSYAKLVEGEDGEVWDERDKERAGFDGIERKDESGAFFEGGQRLSIQRALGGGAGASLAKGALPVPTSAPMQAMAMPAAGMVHGRLDDPIGTLRCRPLNRAGGGGALRFPLHDPLAAGREDEMDGKATVKVKYPIRSPAGRPPRARPPAQPVRHRRRDHAHQATAHRPPAGAALLCRRG